MDQKREAFRCFNTLFQFIKSLGYLTVLLLLIGCTRNVEIQRESPCASSPGLYEIMWKTNVNGEAASLTVKVGDTIRWIWDEENMPHDVSSDDPGAPNDFGSSILTGLGITYEYVFTEPGVFDYKCSVHPASMFGTITVVSCE